MLHLIEIKILFVQLTYFLWTPNGPEKFIECLLRLWQEQYLRERVVGREGEKDRLLTLLPTFHTYSPRVSDVCRRVQRVFKHLVPQEKVICSYCIKNHLISLEKVWLTFKSSKDEHFTSASLGDLSHDRVSFCQSCDVLRNFPGASVWENPYIFIQ